MKTPLSDMTVAPEFVIIGRVRKAHGIRGEVVVEPLTDAPDVIFASGRRLYAGTVAGDPSRDAQRLTVHEVRPFKEGFLVRFEEITDRNAADLWRERYLLLRRDEIPQAADDEVYLHDLLGLRVQLATGEVIGKVEAFYELPQGLMLEIRRQSGTAMLPYRAEMIERVDVKEGVLVVTPPDGLFA